MAQPETPRVSVWSPRHPSEQPGQPGQPCTLLPCCGCRPSFPGLMHARSLPPSSPPPPRASSTAGAAPDDSSVRRAPDSKHPALTDLSNFASHSSIIANSFVDGSSTRTSFLLLNRCIGPPVGAETNGRLRYSRSSSAIAGKSDRRHTMHRAAHARRSDSTGWLPPAPPIRGRAGPRTTTTTTMMMAQRAMVIP